MSLFLGVALGLIGTPIMPIASESTKQRVRKRDLGQRLATERIQGTPVETVAVNANGECRLPSLG